mgnify:CR=1 FL=1
MGSLTNKDESVPPKTRELISRLEPAGLVARHPALLLCAWWLLGWYRAATLVLPLKRVVGEPQRSQPQPAPLTPAQLEQARRVGRLVAVAARATPWRSRCLVQALATRRLLAARGIPGQIHLGVCCEGGFAAHAWLQCGGEVVNGGAGHERFTVISALRW